MVFSLLDNAMKCKECDKPASVRGWCKVCYYRCRPMPDCEVEGCTNRQRSGGLCGKHKSRKRRQGSELWEPETPEARFDRQCRLNSTTQCVVWTGGLFDSGYGAMSFDGKNLRAHRYQWQRHNGNIPEGLIVRHLCNNRKCVNIDHLALGTPKDNAQDCIDSGNRPRGEDVAIGKLTESDVMEIRSRRGTHTALAKEYGVSPRSISLVRNYETWKHLP